VNYVNVISHNSKCFEIKDKNTDETEIDLLQYKPVNSNIMKVV
jgi:hypothetical protein